MAKYILVHGIRVAKDFTPETFGRLTTLGPAFLVGETATVVCQCSCGHIGTFKYSKIKNGYSKSCGCLQKEIARTRAIENGKASKTHGLSKSPEYMAYHDIIRRCHDSKNKGFMRYGGRGIKVCDRWLGESGFQNFFDDMGNRPSPRHSIDRIDNDGNYCPENCRWATAKEQSNNRRSNVIITAMGKSQTIAQWASETGLSHSVIWHRVFKHNWPVEKALLHATR